MLPLWSRRPRVRIYFLGKTRRADIRYLGARRLYPPQSALPVTMRNAESCTASPLGYTGIALRKTSAFVNSKRVFFIGKCKTEANYHSVCAFSYEKR